MTRTKPNISQLARERGLNSATVHSRIQKGMSLEQALNEPIEGYFKRAWKTNREEMIEKGRLSRLKTYVAISPKGERIVIIDLPEFCAERDLLYSSLQLYIREGKTYKGWTIKRLLSDSHKASQPTK